jgi:hypothetical protein
MDANPALPTAMSTAEELRFILQHQELLALDPAPSIKILQIVQVHYPFDENPEIIMDADGGRVIFCMDKINKPEVISAIYTIFKELKQSLSNV